MVAGIRAAAAQALRPPLRSRPAPQGTPRRLLWAWACLPACFGAAPRPSLTCPGSLTGGGKFQPQARSGRWGDVSRGPHGPCQPAPPRRRPPVLPCQGSLPVARAKCVSWGLGSAYVCVVGGGGGRVLDVWCRVRMTDGRDALRPDAPCAPPLACSAARVLVCWPGGLLCAGLS